MRPAPTQGQILQESQRLSHFTGIVLITLAGLPTAMAFLSSGQLNANVTISPDLPKGQGRSHPFP